MGGVDASIMYCADQSELDFCGLDFEFRKGPTTIRGRSMNDPWFRINNTTERTMASNIPQQVVDAVSNRSYISSTPGDVPLKTHLSSVAQRFWQV